MAGKIVWRGVERQKCPSSPLLTVFALFLMFPMLSSTKCNNRKLYDDFHSLLQTKKLHPRLDAGLRTQKLHPRLNSNLCSLLAHLFSLALSLLSFHYWHSNFLSIANFSGAIPLVMMSATWHSVLILANVMSVPGQQCAQKKWYLTAMCFVWGDILVAVAMLSAPLLSSNTVDLISDLTCGSKFSSVAISHRSHCTGRNSLMAWLRARYSASVELRAISVCSLKFHTAGHPPRVKT